MESKEVQQLLNQLREKVESKESDTGLVKEEIKKLNAAIDGFESKNQELTKQLLAKDKAETELKEKVELLEKKFLRMPSGMGATEKSTEMKTFEKFIIDGKEALTVDEIKSLGNVSSDELKSYVRGTASAGGVLCPREYVTEIQKIAKEVSAIRTVARVRTTSKGEIELPNRATRVGSNWIGEAVAATESNSTYASDVIKLGKLAIYSKISNEMLQDSSFNMDAEITADFREELEIKEGAAFLSGDGTNKPEGILTATGITEIVSGAANALTADSVIKVSGLIKRAYNPVYGLNRKTLTALRTLKDNQGRYLLTAGLADGMPNMINGYKYIDLPDMPDEGAGVYPLIFGDFLKGYTILDTTNYGIIRDALTLAAEDLVRFVLMYRVGGKVTMKEAFAKVKCST